MRFARRTAVGRVRQVDEQDAELVAAEPDGRVREADGRRSRSPTARITSSPVAWPWPSLIALNPSRSMASRARTAPVPLGGLDRVVEPRVEARAIEQPGHRIVRAISCSSWLCQTARTRIAQMSAAHQPISRR